MTSKAKAIFILWEDTKKLIYSPESVKVIAQHCDIHPQVLNMDNWAADKALLADVEYIFSGWGMAIMDADFLAAAPKLKHVFYGSGTVRGFYTEAALASSVTISSAWRANAVPVAEFAHATIILALKNFFRANRQIKKSHKWQRPDHITGAFRSTVGLLSLGAIGRMVAERLHSNHQLRVIAHDPYASEAQAAELGIELVSLERLFIESDVVSIHTPNLPTTRGMVNRHFLSLMKPGTTLVNTARGQVIDEAALVDVLRERTDLDAILDVTATEPDNADSPLWNLPNAVMTPHIAGSMDLECRRMGEYMVEEFTRYLKGQPLQHEVTEALLKSMA